MCLFKPGQIQGTELLKPPGQRSCAVPLEPSNNETAPAYQDHEEDD